MEAIFRNFLEKGAELSKMNYKEKRASFAIVSCNAVLINHATKKYWYTLKEDAEKIIAITNKQS